jgi:hypothetical protein
VRRYIILLFGKAHTVPQTTLQDTHGIVEVSRSLAASIVLIGYHERGMTLKTYFLDTGNAGPVYPCIADSCLVYLLIVKSAIIRSGP